jgi:galactoside O-acetyltransferase
MNNPLDPGYYCSEELRSFGFKAVGENVRISRNCVVIGPQNISLGDNIRIDSGTTIIATGGRLTLSGFNHIGGQCHFCVAADLTFDEYSGTSQGVRIYTASDDLGGRSSQPVVARAIEIAAFVGIGSSSVILPGAHIREGSVIGALSLVNRPLRPWGVYHGNPVKRINDRPRDIQAMLHAVQRRLGVRELKLAS